MKRSLINLLTNMTAILLVVFTFAWAVHAEQWNFYRKPAPPKQEQQQTSRSAPVVRAQIGGGGYSTPSLSPSTPSYAPAPYPDSTAPAYSAPAYSAPNSTAPPANYNYNSPNTNTGTTSGWRAPNSAPSNAGTSPAANYGAATNPAINGYTRAAGSYQQPPAANMAATSVPAVNPSSTPEFQSAPTKPAYGQDQGFPDFNWLPGTGPPPGNTGDPAGQGGYLNEGGGLILPEDPNARFFDPDYINRSRFADLRILASETQTGRLMFGVGVNSDAGLIGNIVLDEQNFDWQRFPRSFEDIRDATAWRGAGQRFRLEAVPGTQVQRYMATFQEPYLFGSRVSLGLSGNYYTRIYRDWSEDRVGGSVQLGYHLTHSLTGSLGFRGARVDMYNIVNPAPQELTDAAGRNALYGFQARLAHDTRDSTFMPTEGHLIELGAEQVIGTYQYPKIDLDIRKYFMMHERPDGSGRHVLSLSYRVGWAGDDTPIYDHYFAGGFSTIRGFDYRGASPYDAATGVFVGGQFQMLASAEYLFPITADDMLRGVVFCDTGTVERTINQWNDKYRVAPGFGLRITVPAMGPAPIALDFAFPVVKEDSDWVENFSFFVGLTR